MNTKDLDKIRKEYINLITCPKFSYPPKTKTEAMIDWMVISLAIENASVSNFKKIKQKEDL
jgi:hypothetical protein